MTRKGQCYTIYQDGWRLTHLVRSAWQFCKHITKNVYRTKHKHSVCSPTHEEPWMPTSRFRRIIPGRSGQKHIREIDELFWVNRLRKKLWNQLFPQQMLSWGMSIRKFTNSDEFDYTTLPSTLKYRIRGLFLGMSFRYHNTATDRITSTPLQGRHAI